MKLCFYHLELINHQAGRCSLWAQAFVDRARARARVATYQAHKPPQTPGELIFLLNYV